MAFNENAATIGASDLAPIEIGDFKIGVGSSCYVVAEIGINHNGDIELAKEAIDAAKLAGANAVKFQNYRTEDFISDRSLEYSYESQGKKVTESQFDMFKRYELSKNMLMEIFEYCRSVDIDAHSTPTNSDGVQDLVDLGVGILKNGSDFLTHLPLIKEMGKTGLPTVLSTGMATEEEVDGAVNAFRSTGNENLILLHCTSQYPTPPEDLNLQAMSFLQDRYNCLVGFSDHSEGVTASAISVGLGAVWIEKHFTLDKTLQGPDHRFSSDPAEFASLVQAVRYSELANGYRELRPTASEAESRAAFRLSCVAARELEKGAVLTKDCIAFRRPGTGISPAGFESLVGQELKKSVASGHVFLSSDFAKK